MSELNLPDRYDLLELPRWARVAFAARCARRVLPLITHSDLDEKHTQAVEIAERCAANPSSAHIDIVESTLTNAKSAVDHIKINPAGQKESTAATRYAVIVTSYAIRGYVSADNNDHFSAISTSDCASDAAAAAKTAGADADAVLAMLSDYHLLLAAAKELGWDDDTPVAPEFFGPLWPNGAPDGWPEQEETSEGYALEVKIKFNLPDDTPEEALHEYLQELALKANSLHRAYGGHGLKITGMEVKKPARVPEEVGT